jgi:hypothetical protein
MNDVFVKPNYRGKKYEKIILNASKTGKVDTYIKHPDTGIPIRLPMNIVERIHNGETVMLDEIISERKKELM